MLDQPSEPPRLEMDALSEVLHDFRLTGVSYGRCQLRHPWGISFPEQALLRIHVVCRGQPWLFTEATGWQLLQEGDVVLLPQGVAHRLASAPEIPCTPVDANAVAHYGGNVCDLVQPGEGAGATLFCGTMALDAHALHPLIALMPPVLRSCDVLRQDPMMLPLVEAMAVEAETARVGGGTVLSRMADLLATHVIRAWVDCCETRAQGWLAAIRDPRISQALAAIHRDPGRNWTLAGLALVAGQSRSVFAERFSALMGEGPAHYVARWRMKLAHERLRQPNATVATVAADLGYESEASFSRAFKRVTGRAPGSVRRSTQSGRTDTIFGQ
jgi:AraC-like DNA-binding protein